MQIFIKSAKADGAIITEFQTRELIVKLGRKCVLYKYISYNI